MKVVVSAELGIDARQYLLERDGAAFRSFIAEASSVGCALRKHMSLLEYEITRCWTEPRGGQTVTKVRINSKPDVGAWIPNTLKSKVPDALEYYDEVEYRPDALAVPPYELAITSVAPFLGDKAKLSSRTLIEPLGPGRCRHTLEQTLEFSGLFGLGMVAKRLAKRSLEQSFEDMPAIIDRWVHVREELLQTPHGRERLLAGRPKVHVTWMEEEAGRIMQQGQLHEARPAHVHRRSAHKHTRGLAPQALPPAAPDGEAEVVGAAGGEAAALMSPFAALAQAPPAPSAALPLPAAAVATAPQLARPASAKQMSSAGTAFLTPTASLASSASGQVAVAAVPGGSAAAAALLPEPPGTATPAAGGRPRVWAEQLANGAEPTRHGSSTSVSAEPSHSYTEGKEVEGSSGSEASDGGQSREQQGDTEDWGHCTPWRTYYRSLAMKPLRAHTLPPALVRRLASLGRPQPVHVAKLGGPGGGGGGRRKHSKLKAMISACVASQSAATK